MRQPVSVAVARRSLCYLRPSRWLRPVRDGPGNGSARPQRMHMRAVQRTCGQAACQLAWWLRSNPRAVARVQWRNGGTKSDYGRWIPVQARLLRRPEPPPDPSACPRPTRGYRRVWARQTRVSSEISCPFRASARASALSPFEGRPRRCAQG